MGIWDDLTGNTAAAASNAAAADTYGKQTAATGAIRTAGNQYATGMRDLSTAYDPYVSAGGSALQRLQAGLGLGGDTGAFTAAYHALPGYQSGLDTGTNAAIRGINAGGMLQSGAAMKALQRYGSDYEDQKSGDYLNRLAQLQGQGLQATGAQTGLVGQGLQGQLGAQTAAYGGDMNAAQTIGQGMVAGAQAQQQGLQNLLSTGANLAGTLGGSYLRGPGGSSGLNVPGWNPFGSFGAAGPAGGVGGGSPNAWSTYSNAYPTLRG